MTKLSLLKSKEKKKKKAIIEWSFKPGPKVHALVQTVKEEDHYVDIFLCKIGVQYMPYCIRTTSHVVLSRTKHPWWILLAILDAFSRLCFLWLQTYLTYFCQRKDNEASSGLY